MEDNDRNLKLRSDSGAGVSQKQPKLLDNESLDSNLSKDSKVKR